MDSRRRGPGEMAKMHNKDIGSGKNAELSVIERCDTGAPGMWSNFSDGAMEGALTLLIVAN